MLVVLFNLLIFLILAGVAFILTKLFKSNFSMKIMIFVGLYLVVSCVQLPLQAIEISHSLLMQLLWAGVYFAGFAFAIWIAGDAYRKYGYRTPKKVSWHDVGFVIFSYVIALIGESGLNFLNYQFSHQVSSKNNDLIVKLLSSNHVIMIIMVISMVCLSPILEELVFRGFLMDAFFSPKWFWVPILTSGVFFASGHLVSTIISFATYVYLGMVLAYVYRKSQNIRLSMMLHALNNLLSVISLLSLLLH